MEDNNDDFYLYKSDGLCIQNGRNIHNKNKK